MKGYKNAITVGLMFLFILFPCHVAVSGAPPASPTGLTAIAGNGEASLTWNAVSGATGYILCRATVSGGPYGFVAETQGTGHSNRGLANGSKYYYVVIALNADGQSAYSAEVSVTPKDTVLPAPTGMSAIPGNGEVSVSWAPVGSAVSYNVYRATARGGPYALLSSPSGPSFTDRGLTNGTPYFYVVQTLKSTAGAYSDEVSATPSTFLPVAPVMGTTALAGNGEASITWGAVSGAASYALYRGAAAGGFYSFVAETKGTGYTNRGLANGSKYCYVVTALNAAGQSAYSAEVSVTPNDIVFLPAPTGISAIPGNGEVSLVWSPVTSAVSYNVYRATARGGPYARLASAPGPS
ncbi:MAG: fibronectin type III domain-containing protein, partial [Syntrophales bacterium]